ncbi:MAG: hypothetical protein KGZ25_10255, partial [Planctomycetes bacterium]|nr:hypothetical protein [Planctomycetota bacterium]
RGNLHAREFGQFSVPHSFCLAGEKQHLLGLGSIVFASDSHLEVEVHETLEDFHIRLVSGTETSAGKNALDRLKHAILETTRYDSDELHGLDICLSYGNWQACCRNEELLSSPAAGVALAAAVFAHRGPDRQIGEKELLETAGMLLESASGERRIHPQQFDARCCASLRGGAMYLSSTGEPLNVQWILPSESVVLVLDPEGEPQPGRQQWEEDLLSALQKMDGASKLISQTEDDIGALFEMTDGKLTDTEISILYGLLRVREMIQTRIEKMAPVTDNDRLAEICDEESALIQDYMGFPDTRLPELRKEAVEAGALGAKLTFAFGNRPGLILLAPNRREEVVSTMGEELGEEYVVPLNIDHNGLKAEIG